MNKTRLHWWEVVGILLGTAVVLHGLCGIVTIVHYAIEYRDNPPQGDSTGGFPVAAIGYMAITVIAFPFIAALAVCFQWWLRQRNGFWATRLAILGLASPLLFWLAIHFWHHVDYAIWRFIVPERFS